MAPPVLTEETQDLDRAYVKNSGETLRLVCEALGKPEPEVTWYRDHQMLSSTSNGGGAAGGFGRAVLSIKNLIEGDSGTLTCLAQNALGSVSKNFSLRVEDSSRYHPVVSKGPENTTVKVGESTSLECRVQSPTKPTIKWLKKLEQFERDEEDLEGEIVDIGENNKFRVIHDNNYIEEEADSFAIAEYDGRRGKRVGRTMTTEYTNILTIEDASEADEGMYYCVVTNTIGFKYKNAYLTVVPSTYTLN